MSSDDQALVEALRRGDESAFAQLVDEHSSALLRLATMYVGDRAAAEEVVQETWIAVLQGIDRFEGRSSLKTWLFRILANKAKTKRSREARSLPFSALSSASEADEPAVEAERFLADGGWALAPVRWETPEEKLLSGETRDVILRTIEALPPAQREVIALRDVEGWPSNEVCDALEISETNQRVLLHRARAKVRAAIEAYLGAVRQA
jgi:RNA polymerase sigma-70 factor (ECF subfamily)